MTEIQRLFKGSAIGALRAPLIFKELVNFNFTEGVSSTYIMDGKYKIGEKVYAIYEGNAAIY